MKRALIVDAHNLFRQLLAVMLEQHTTLKENVQAGSLAEARRVWDDLDRKVDLVIVTLDLPNGDGTDLIEELCEAVSAVPVLALTVGRSLEQRTRALRAGANEVLSTASSGEEITGAARRLVGE